MGAVGLIAVGAMMFQGLPGLGSGGSDGSDTDSESQNKSDDKSTKPAEYGDVVVFQIVGEGYEVRELRGDEITWRAVGLDEITELAKQSKGNEVGIKVRYYVDDTAVFDAETKLRETLESAVSRSKISIIDREGF